MIRKILIITSVLIPLLVGVAFAEIKAVKTDTTLNPADGCYGAPARIYAQADDTPEHGLPDSSLFDSQSHGPDGFRGPGPQHLERLRLRKLLELLELDETQRDQFIELFRGMRAGMIENRNETKQIIDRLARGLRSGDISDEEIKGLLAELDRIDEQKFQHMRELHAEFKRILTPRQLGKFYIFRERFEPRILEHLGQRRGKGKFPRQFRKPMDFPADSSDSLKR